MSLQPSAYSRDQFGNGSYPLQTSPFDAAGNIARQVRQVRQTCLEWPQVVFLHTLQCTTAVALPVKGIRLVAYKEFGSPCFVGTAGV